MLQAYLDDSGTHDGSHNCLIGGYWGSVNEWKRFEREWKPILDSEGIDEFHANDFWFRKPDGTRVGIYKDWSEERHARFIDRLLTTIENRKIYPFACGVLREEWDKQPSDLKERYAGVTNAKHLRPEFLCVQRVVIGSSLYCHSGITMHFVADEPSSSSLRTSMLGCFLDLKQGFRESGDAILEKIGEFTYADSRKALPLQAADLLAYEAHRYAKKNVGDPNFPMRVEYKRAMRRFRSKDDFWMFNQKRFSDLEQALRSAVVERQEMQA